MSVLVICYCAEPKKFRKQDGSVLMAVPSKQKTQKQKIA